MGRNFISGCHKCRTQVFHYRGKESKTLHAFYEKHETCIRKNHGNVETLDDQLQEFGWMNIEKSGGYKNQWVYDDEKRCYKI